MSKSNAETKVRLMANDSNGDTDKAYRCWEPTTNRTIWVPKSLVSHVSREMADINGNRYVVLTVKEWWAVKEGLA